MSESNREPEQSSGVSQPLSPSTVKGPSPVSSPALEEIVERFAQAWERGENVLIDDFLPFDEFTKWAVLVQLVHTDLEFRLKAGQEIRVETYFHRYPELANDETVLLELIEAEYEGHLRCGHTIKFVEYLERFPQYRDKLSAVLQTVCEAPRTRHRRFPIRLHCPHCRNPMAIGEGQADAEIVCPSCGSTFRIDTNRTDSWQPGKLPRVGKFELLRKLGQGSFGTVYQARDTQLDALVAIKVPRSGSFSTEQDEDRFVREARSVAQLRGHPGIIPVYEVGRTDTFPYIVCEFVEGITLADALDSPTRRPFTFRESAELLAQITDAVQYCHQHGVIHRDLKPSNVMLQKRDGLYARIMDFGLARRDEWEVAVTVDGQVLGTPGYMSPEQAKGEGHRADGRADVYSLGVMLYKLLTQELPFQGSHHMVVHQHIHDDPRPPRQLNNHIPRDLETITVKCLAKEPSGRYHTAGELADDLNRYLRGEPILARPIGPMSRGWRWCQRNPVVASLALGVAALLLILAVGSVVYSLRLRQYAAREHVARTEAETYFRMTIDAIDQFLTEVGGESLMHIPQAEPVRKKLLQKALELHRGLLKSDPSHPELRLEFARAHHRMGSIYEQLGEHESGRAAYEESLRMLEEMRAEHPEDPTLNHFLAISHTDVGELFRRTAPQQAEEHYQYALQRQLKLHRLSPSNTEYQWQLSRTWNNLGLLLTEVGRFQQSEDALKSAIAHLEELSAEVSSPPDFLADLARSQINLGMLLGKQPKRATEAERPYRKAITILQRLVDDYPEHREHGYKLSVALLDLGNLLILHGNNDAAKIEARECVEQSNSRLIDLRDNFPGIPLYRYELANSYNSLANSLVRLGEFELARRNLDLAKVELDQLELKFADYSQTVAEFHSLQGTVQGGLGALAFEIDKDAQTARRHIAQAIQNQTEALEISPNNPKYIDKLRAHHTYLARILRDLGLDQEAEPLTGKAASAEKEP